MSDNTSSQKNNSSGEKNLEKDKNATLPDSKSEKEAMESLNRTIQSMTDKIRGGREWLGKPGMCEWCGYNEATHNLDLKFGSHRECKVCWED